MKGDQMTDMTQDEGRQMVEVAAMYLEQLPPIIANLVSLGENELAAQATDVLMGISEAIRKPTA